MTEVEKLINKGLRNIDKLEPKDLKEMSKIITRELKQLKRPGPQDMPQILDYIGAQLIIIVRTLLNSNEDDKEVNKVINNFGKKFNELIGLLNKKIILLNTLQKYNFDRLVKGDIQWLKQQ